MKPVTAMPTSSPLTTLLQGSTGVLGSLLAYLGTTVQDLEACLRIASIGAGLIVAILTAIKLIMDITKRKQ